MRKEKSTLYLIAAALITLLAGSCTDRSVPEPTPQEGVSLSFEQSEIEVDALGGEYSVYYTLTNGIDNIAIRATLHPKFAIKTPFFDQTNQESCSFYGENF